MFYVLSNTERIQTYSKVSSHFRKKIQNFSSSVSSHIKSYKTIHSSTGYGRSKIGKREKKTIKRKGTSFKRCIVIVFSCLFRFLAHFILNFRRIMKTEPKNAQNTTTKNEFDGSWIHIQMDFNLEEAHFFIEHFSFLFYSY